MLFTMTVLGQVDNKNLEFQEYKYKIRNLSINTKLSDFGVRYITKSTVVFSAPKKEAFFQALWRDNHQPYLELYYGKINSKGSIVRVKKFSKDINSKYHEAELAITKDGKKVYFTGNNHIDGKGIKGDNDKNNLQIYSADFNKGEFRNIKLLPFNSDNFSTGHPCLSNDNKTLYFVSNRASSLGQTDLFKVAILEEGKFGEVVNLGNKMNTPNREMFPFINKDDVLFFASDREGTTGGLDVFATSLRDSTTTIHKLPSPINSIEDDFAFVMGDSNFGFLSSNRKGGKGDDDIYKVKIIKPEPKPEKVVEKKLYGRECNQLLVGVVTEKATKKPLKNANVYLFNYRGIVIDSVTTSSSGNYRFYKRLDCNTRYTVKSTKKDHVFDRKELTTSDINDKTNKVDLVLTSKDFKVNEIGKLIIKIDPIYFDYDKANIRPDAALILDKVVETMFKHPSIVVEGGSHTDSRGSSSYNEKLSARRARSTVNYILSKGISPRRISSRGYGESQPVNRCEDGVKCSDEEHQKNRRTEFVILPPK